jgi:RNA-binding protein 26
LQGTAGSPAAPRGPQNGSRKRSYNDRGDNDFQEGRESQSGADIHGRNFKQSRRGNIGRGGQFDGRGNGRGGWQNQQSSPMGIPGMPVTGFSNMPPMPSPPPGMPPIDPNNPMAALLAMQAMGFPVPGVPGFTPQGSPPIGQSRSPAPGFNPTPKRSDRCRDYDTKGFCARGDSCRFEHGNDPVYVPPTDGLHSLLCLLSQTFTYSYIEYDPSNSSLMSGVEVGAVPNIATPYPAGFQTMRVGDRGRGRGRGDRGGPISTLGRRGGRAEFSSDRPNFDKTKTTIVIENIPEEKFSESAVQDFFSEFGSITEVEMRPYKRLALVKYDDWAAAKAAYNSPKVIFDNRFVKVYWFTDTESLPKPPSGANENAASSNGNNTSGPIPARHNSEPQIDLEEFARKQEEVQRVHEEKMRKKSEMESAQKELERRQEELLKNQAEEKRKLMEKIAAKSGKTIQENSVADTDGKPKSQTDTLKAQLAALEAEAKSLGIDPASAEDTTWAGRGRGRGRGDYRGGYRGRGPFVPRGRGSDRGVFRGRGGASHAGGGNIYKLDNRPKKIVLSGIDFTNPEKDESLRQYLLVSHLRLEVCASAANKL